VISGIRFREEVEVFKKEFGGSFFLVAIVCDERLRYERVVRRERKGEASISFDEFRGVESKPTERVIGDTMAGCRFRARQQWDDRGTPFPARTTLRRR